MVLEEIVNVPFLPKKEYENPVTVKLEDEKLVVSYTKGGIFRINHYFELNGRPCQYTIDKITPYPRIVLDDFVDAWIKEKHGYKNFISRIEPEDKKNLIDFLYENNDDFRGKYMQLTCGYYELYESVEVIENKPTLYNEDFYEISVCNRIIHDLAELVKKPELKNYLENAKSFDHRLLLPSRNNLNKKKHYDYRN